MFPLLFALLVPCILLVGCSTPESKDWLDTTLCWLRPSCLPSQPPQRKAPKKPLVSKPSPVTPKKEQVQNDSPNNNPLPCLTSTETTPASESVKRISYIEPTTQADGKTLTDLDKTSIYFHLGDDRIKLKDCTKTNPQGGGRIPKGGETISVNIPFPIREGSKICVTATDITGNESSKICEPIKN